MSRRTFFSRLLIVTVLLGLSAEPVLADGASDLAAGRTAMEAGELDKARGLLEAAAMALPESVDAQLALAECYLKLGESDKALAGYQRVVKLSPQHKLAKQIVESLTGAKQTFAERIALAEAFIKIGAFAQAETVLAKAIAQPAEPAERERARLLLAEALLWSHQPAKALPEAMRLVQSTQYAKEGRVLALLALWAAGEDADSSQALLRELIDNEQMNQPWSGRSQLATLLLQLSDESKAAEISAKFHDALTGVPSGPFRVVLINKVAERMTTIARKHAERGDLETAALILLPMVGEDIGAEAEKPDPAKLPTKWLDRNVAHAAAWEQASQVFVVMARTELWHRGPGAELLGYWRAAEVLRQMPGDENASVDKILEIANELAGRSRPKPTRKPGEPLSAADAVQYRILMKIAPRLSPGQPRLRWVQLVVAQVIRYEQQDDRETGLALFVPTLTAHDKPVIDLKSSALTAIPPGQAHLQLIQALGERVAQEGQRQFQKAAATQDADANQKLNRFDAVALAIYGEWAPFYSTEPALASGAQAIIDRYATAGRWTAAGEAIALFHRTTEGDAARWAVARLKLRQALDRDEKTLNANRLLGKELSPLAQEGLAELVKIVKESPTKGNRQAAISIVEPMAARYGALQRFDLAEQVVAATADPLPETLGDWALWVRANLLEQQAGQAIAVAVTQFNGAAKITLNEHHKAELALLDQLVSKHAESDYAPKAIQRLSVIANTYQSHGSFDTARGVLSEFVKAHPKLESVPQLEYQIVQIALLEARQVFDKRKDKTKPPEKLSEEYAKAADAIAAFLKAHPEGALANGALNDLLSVARLYGEAKAWPVSRELLERFAAAAPDFRSPSNLKLWRAATYLGELDPGYGASLLVPAPVPQLRLPPTTDTALALILGDKTKAEGYKLGFEDLDRLWSDDRKLKEPEVAASGKPVVSFGGRADDRAGGDMPATSSPVGQAMATPSSDSLTLAMIRDAHTQRTSQIAMMELPPGANGHQGQQANQAAIALPSGPVLSEAEQKRQDEAADKAYEILIELVNSATPAEAAAAQQARNHVFWLFGFFESQQRHDRTVVLIARFLADRPTDADRVQLAFRSLNDRLAWAARRTANDRVDQRWLDKRHELFEETRGEIAAFIKEFATKSDWVNEARLLEVDSYQRESRLAVLLSPVRAAGLLVQSADALIALFETAPDHPAAEHFGERLWQTAEQLHGIGQSDQAIYVLSQIPMHFPTSPRSNPAVLRIAEFYAANLSNPLRAVETYQEYMSLAGDNEAIRTQIFTIAQQLASKQRYLEALHVLGVFVDSFPTDPRAADALRSIGQTHQANEAWDEAIKAYERILVEFPGAPVTPLVKLAMAECRINLSQWKAARKLYEEFVRDFPQDGQVELARTRLEVLKNLDRFQTLLADEHVQRNKDDAQFQIGVIVREKLANPVKAVEEFRKVVANYPKSPQADDAQLEIGKALLALNRLDEARAELVKVPRNFPDSPLADDALYLVGQSYEQAAQRLASVTVEKARELAFEASQRGAYMNFSKQLSEQKKDIDSRRDELKRAGKTAELALDEANAAWRFNGGNFEIMNQNARKAQLDAETETAMQVANRQDRINEAYRQAVAMYSKAAADYPLGDMTDESLLRMAQIFETEIKDRVAAMDTYQKVVKFFPGTPVAENAAWKVAAFHDQEGKYREAVDAYREFIRNYPASSRVAEAQFAMAEALEQLGRWVEAMDAYETFRQKFTDHPKAQLALEQINWIRAYRK